MPCSELWEHISILFFQRRTHTLIKHSCRFLCAFFLPDPQNESISPSLIWLDQSLQKWLIQKKTQNSSFQHTGTGVFSWICNFRPWRRRNAQSLKASLPSTCCSLSQCLNSKTEFCGMRKKYEWAVGAVTQNWGVFSGAVTQKWGVFSVPCFGSSSQGKLLVDLELKPTLSSTSKCHSTGRPDGDSQEASGNLKTRNVSQPARANTGLCSVRACGCCEIQTRGAAGAAFPSFSPLGLTQEWSLLFSAFLRMAHWAEMLTCKLSQLEQPELLGNATSGVPNENHSFLPRQISWRNKPCPRTPTQPGPRISCLNGPWMWQVPQALSRPAFGVLQHTNLVSCPR